MANLVIENLCKGWDFPVIDELSMAVQEGEFFVIVGPSGIGKTTLLRLISGLEKPDAGKVIIANEDITHKPPYRRRVAMTFESYALYPHLSVFDNIASPLRARGVKKSDITRRVNEVAKLLQIDPLLQRKPGEVSGGQKQRTALGRTLVADPDVFLLDEPLSHLDAKIRHELRVQFHTLEELRRVACVYVTHDYAEALSLGDRIGIMGQGGRLIQVGKPRELFEKPENVFVAEHLGQPSINLIDAELSSDKTGLILNLKNSVHKIPVAAAHRTRLEASGVQHLTVGLRPQHIRPVDELPTGFELDALVDVFEPLGSTGIMLVTDNGLQLTATTDPERHFDAGQLVKLRANTEAFHYFDASSGRNLLLD